MINLPSEIRKNLELSIGDEISFIKTESGYIIVPVKNLFDLTNPEEMGIAKEIIEEIREERRRDANK